jgi:hypothetical protein
MRLRAVISLAVVLLISSLLVLQPMSVAAADCSKERAAFDALAKEADALNKELQADLRDLGIAQGRLATVLQKMDSVQNDLAGQGDRVRQQLDQKGMWEALKVLGPEVVASILIALAEPELVGESIHLLLEVAEKAHTAVEVYNLFKDASEADSVLAELTSELGSLDAARAFAQANGLTELTYMINKEAELAGLMKDYQKAWDDFEKAADAVVADTALLDAKGKQLEAAQVALYACLGVPAPPPSADPCSGQKTNPGGAGVCR